MYIYSIRSVSGKDVIYRAMKPEKKEVRLSRLSVEVGEAGVSLPFSTTVPPPRKGLAIRPKFKADMDCCDFCVRACSKRSRTACSWASNLERKMHE